MEFKFRAVDDRPSSSTTAFFSQHALRGQTVPPTSTLTFSTSQPTMPPPVPSVFPNTDIRRNPNPIQNPTRVREAIQRQLEKERIREEIIATEIARRRVLEAEVRRELMLEREVAMRRAAGEGLEFEDRFGAMRFDPRLPLRHSFDDRFAFGSGTAAFNTLSLPRLPEPEHNDFKPDKFPFASGTFSLRRLPEPVPNEFKPPRPSELKKHKLIVLAKPDRNISGLKRKTPPTAGAGELPPFGLKKKPKEEWSCAVCQVSATSERGLNQHLEGKKHKAKEAGLRAQKLGKSCRKAPLPRKSGKLSEPKETNGIPSSDTFLGLLGKIKKERELLDRNETNDVLAKKMQELPMQKEQCGEDLKNKNEAKKVHKVEGKEELKKNKKYKFWCEMCKTGTHSPKVMANHKAGKKHVARLQKLAQNNVSTGKSPALSEAIKKAEDADVAEEANESIPTTTPKASLGETEKAENTDLTKETIESTAENVADSNKSAACLMENK